MLKLRRLPYYRDVGPTLLVFAEELRNMPDFTGPCLWYLQNTRLSTRLSERRITSKLRIKGGTKKLQDEFCTDKYMKARGIAEELKWSPF